MILAVRGHTPQIGDGCFVAPSAQIIGQVQIGRESSVWFNAVLRGDVMPIIIGEQTNIQDGTIIHGTFNQAAAEIGHRVTVGHSVVLHGCRVNDLCLIGMGSILMDHSVIGERSIVGAGSLVTEGSKFDPGMLILGRPAKAVRPLRENELAFLSQSAKNYMHYMEWYR